MKPFQLSAAVLFSVVAAASADLVIEQKVESPQINSTVVTKIKGDKVRLDIAKSALGPTSVITDSKTGDSVNLMHATKIAMKAGGAQMKQTLEAFAKQLGGGDASAKPVAPQGTGKTEKIGDYDCEIYTWSNGAMSGRYWVAKNHPQAAMLKEAEKRMSSGLLSGIPQGADAAALPGPAMKTETTAGGNTTTITVVSVKEQNVDEKDFEVPADYQPLAFPQVPGFGGQGGGVPPAPGAK
jgi:hypothetical protein